ncbi:MAG: YicC family protein [Gammaproteobacteria bacterium]|nr:YicC family protein [Gammaproteobacteria bacterium]
MIQSMTAFARESMHTSGGTLTIELRSVNHRYLDCSLKMPDSLRALEPELREGLVSSLARGKVECFIKMQANAAEPEEMAIHEPRLAALIAATESVNARLDSDRVPDALSLLQFPGIYTAREASEDALQQDTLALFRAALANLQQARSREGAKLAELVTDRLVQVETQVAATRAVMPELMQHQRAKITRRIAELEVEVDEGRLEQELVYLSQKADVDEELDRLDAHIAEVRRTIKKGGPCGRRLDFLMQELNREANTLSSKSQSATTTLDAVELKVLIEQMREQIQNIE